jgi:hypothetical protein
VLVVVVVAAAFLGLHGTGHTRQQPAGIGAPKAATVTFAVPGSSAVVQKTARIVSARLAAAFPHRHRAVRVSGGTMAVSVTPTGPGVVKEIVALGAPGNVYFYDWEANALTPNGETVASQLQAQSPAAVEISQGTARVPPGGGGGEGSTSLYSAVKLAESVHNPPIGAFNSHVAPLHYLFAAAGSAACRIAADDGDHGTSFVYEHSATHSSKLVPGQHCYLAGPDTSLRVLAAALPPGVTRSAAELMTIPRGVTVLEAAGTGSFTNPPDPNGQYYTLLDRVALTGRQITHPEVSTDSGGQPDVTFGLTHAGALRFQQVTETVAHRGQLDSRLGAKLFQHFAIAVDHQLVTVPYIDYTQYPEGLAATTQAEIEGSLTQQTAMRLALLISHPLPAGVHVIRR